MKVDQYRVQKAKEYSFLVPSGADLSTYGQPEKGYFEVFTPFVLEQQDVELETIVTGRELGEAIRDLEADGLAMILTVPINVETNEEGIE